MTPQTTAQNLLLWLAALALAVLLSFLSGIATHWPDGGPIDWRAVALDVIQTILTTAPLVAAGFGLPRLGKENIADLVSTVGKGPAKAALEDEAVRQQTGQAAGAGPLADAQVQQLAAAMHESVANELEWRMQRTAPPVTEADLDDEKVAEQATGGRG